MFGGIIEEIKTQIPQEKNNENKNLSSFILDENEFSHFFKKEKEEKFE